MQKDKYCFHKYVLYLYLCMVLSQSLIILLTTEYEWRITWEIGFSLFFEERIDVLFILVFDFALSLSFKFVFKLDCFEEMGKLISWRIEFILMFLSLKHDVA